MKRDRGFFRFITTDFCRIYCCNLLIVQYLPSLGRFPDDAYHGVVCQACQPSYATLTYPFPMAAQYPVNLLRIDVPMIVNRV